MTRPARNAHLETLSERRLNRALLARQHLLARSEVPFTQVKIFLSGSVASDVHPILDNFSYMNEAPPIENPEVTTVLYVATGVALLALRYRRRGSV